MINFIVSLIPVLFVLILFIIFVFGAICILKIVFKCIRNMFKKSQV